MRLKSDGIKYMRVNAMIGMIDTRSQVFKIARIRESRASIYLAGYLLRASLSVSPFIVMSTAAREMYCFLKDFKSCLIGSSRRHRMNRVARCCHRVFSARPLFLFAVPLDLYATMVQNCRLISLYLTFCRFATA